MRRRIDYLLFALWLADMAWKTWLVRRFLRRPAPPAPSPLPSIALIQPFTRGVHDLPGRLRGRLELQYPGLQQIWVLDRDDRKTLAACEAALGGRADVLIVVAEPDMARQASKMAKMRAALPYATADVLWFLDDDVTLDSAGLRLAVAHLAEPGVGAVFGLARYTNWRTPWSSLLSAFVNANALPSYITLAALVEPYTITGHCFALHRDVFTAFGGLDGMAGRIDDDHELARRVRAYGLRNRQTPLIYAVDNDIPDARAYLRQMRRWFLIPRELMLPHLSRRERIATSLGSAAMPLPLAVALLASTRPTARWLLVAMAFFSLLHYRWLENHTDDRTPLQRWPLVLLRMFSDPLVIGWALTQRGRIWWRGVEMDLVTDRPVKLRSAGE